MEFAPTSYAAWLADKAAQDRARAQASAPVMGGNIWEEDAADAEAEVADLVSRHGLVGGLR